ncbi:MAG: hypothetical protein WBN42_02170 [Ignavibacteriaceae bacterium]
MKNLIVFLGLILVSFESCSLDEDSASVKILAEAQTKKYKFVEGKIDSVGTLYERIIFDQKGRDSVIENYDNSGSLFLYTNLYYDSVGDKIRTVDYKKDGKVESTTDYKYSEKNLLLEIYRRHNSGGFNRSQFFYDSLGHRIKEIWTTKYYIEHLNEWYTSEDILLRTFNENGYCIGVKESADGKPFVDKKTVFDSLGHIIFEDWGDNFRKFRYDKNGNQIEELSLDINNNLVNRWVSVYDSNNIRIEYIKYNFLNEPIEFLKKEIIYK